jgi:hypothetical protein
MAVRGQTHIYQCSPWRKVISHHLNIDLYTRYFPITLKFLSTFVTMMFLESALIASTLCGLSSARSLIKQRDTVDTALFAYGTNVSGAPIIYGDGLAWLGFEVPDWLTVATNVTCIFVLSLSCFHSEDPS